LDRLDRLRDDYRVACRRLRAAERRLSRLETDPTLYGLRGERHDGRMARARDLIDDLSPTLADMYAQLVAAGIDPAEVENG